MAETHAASRWRFLVTPRWVGWHLLMVGTVVGMMALGDWQLHRAESGNGLSWAYTFEWPIFAIFVVVFWVKTIKDEVSPPQAAASGAAGEALPAGFHRAAGSGEAAVAVADDEDDPELAAYNAYLSRLTREVKGHGRWHGLR
jgi:DNA-binding transcriptional regulator of glucitol operon